jgi:hypothetical protein
MHALVVSSDPPSMFEYFKKYYDVKHLYNDRDVKGRTPLHHVALYGTNLSLSYLIGLGFALNLSDHFGRSFLHLFCLNAQERINFTCLETVYNSSSPDFINRPDHAGRTCMHYVNHPDMALRLHRLGGDIEFVDLRGNTPIYRVLPNIKALYLSLGASQSHTDCFGRTPLYFLHEGYTYNHLEWDQVREYLLHTNINHSLCHGSECYSTMHFIVMGKGWLDINLYKLMMNPPCSANPHATTKDGYCVLALLMQKAHNNDTSSEEDLVVLDILFSITLCIVSLIGDLRLTPTQI